MQIQNVQTMTESMSRGTLQKKLLLGLNLDTVLNEAQNLVDSINTDDSSDDDIDEMLENYGKQWNQGMCNKTFSPRREAWATELFNENSSSDEDTNVEDDLRQYQNVSAYRKQIEPLVTSLRFDGSNRVNAQLIFKRQRYKSRSLKRMQSKLDSFGLDNKNTIVKHIKSRRSSQKKELDFDVLRKRIWRKIAKKDIAKGYRLHLQSQNNRFSKLKMLSINASNRVQSFAAVQHPHANDHTTSSRMHTSQNAETERFQNSNLLSNKLYSSTSDKIDSDSTINLNNSQDAEKSTPEIELDVLIAQAELYACGMTSELTDSESNISQVISNNKSFPGSQPSLFVGKMFDYQLQGVSWLAKLFSNQLNGILADEDALSKSLQVVAFLGYLAERMQVFGPFLVVSKDCNVKRWQQEFSEHLPSFKVLRHSGDSSRDVLKVYSDEPEYDFYPFHVLLTTHELILSDMEYFDKINWQYIVVDATEDDTQTRFSSQIAVDFNSSKCVLLKSKPLSTSLPQLWYLLQFLMPNLFQKHVQFECIEDKIRKDKTLIKRLRTALGPFFLRRSNIDSASSDTAVGTNENTLMLCEMTFQQMLIYDCLQKSLVVDKILSNKRNVLPSRSIALKNLVVQFRKVCNHPALIQSKYHSSPVYFCNSTDLKLSKLIYHSFVNKLDSRAHIFCQDLNIHSSYNLHCTMNDARSRGLFSLAYLTGLSLGEYCRLVSNSYDPDELLRLRFSQENLQSQYDHMRTFHKENDVKKLNLFICGNRATYHQDNMWKELVFLHHFRNFFTHVIYRPLNCTGASKGENHSNIQAITPSKLIQNCYQPCVVSPQHLVYCSDSSFILWWHRYYQQLPRPFSTFGQSCFVRFPDDHDILRSSTKMQALAHLLQELSKVGGGQKVLICSKMDAMLRLLEELMMMKQYSHHRITADKTATWVLDHDSSSEFHVYLCGTAIVDLDTVPAINTVIFYDSDCYHIAEQRVIKHVRNQSAKEKFSTSVYYLVCKGTVDQRMFHLAEEKEELQRMMSSSEVAVLTDTEILSVLFDDDKVVQEVLHRHESSHQKRCKHHRKRKIAAPPSKLQSKKVFNVVSPAASPSKASPSKAKLSTDCDKVAHISSWYSSTNRQKNKTSIKN